MSKNAALIGLIGVKLFFLGGGHGSVRRDVGRGCSLPGRV